MASSPFEAEWRGANYAEESGWGLAIDRVQRHYLLTIIWNRATLGGHLEVHMSDRLFSHEVWLSKLKDHLAEERYAAGTSRQCLAVARHFLRCLDKQHVDVSAAQPANVEGIYNRHGGCIVAAMAIHQTTKVGGVSTPMASTCFCAWFRASGHRYRQRSRLSRFCRAKSAESTAQWMTGQRGLAQGTVSHRCSEAGRLLDWLGERATREEPCDPHPSRCGRLHEVSSSGGRQAFAPRCDDQNTQLLAVAVHDGANLPRSFIHRDRTDALRVRKYSLCSSSPGTWRRFWLPLDKIARRKGYAITRS